MNYIGSKYSLLNFLDAGVSFVTKGEVGSFCDIFAGTGVVGTHFKQKGYKIIANDIQYYSYVLNRHYVGNHSNMKFKGLYHLIPNIEGADLETKKELVCDYLSNLRGVNGFIYYNYSLGGTSNKAIQRQYFSDENAQKCDAIRQTIEKWKKDNLINEDEYFFLLASLIESIDKYANTASVYGAFLKKLKKTAQKSLQLKPLKHFLNDNSHQVYNRDSNSIVKDIECDVLYIDPPYNRRQYATNYHLLETIARYDNPSIYGVTGLREYKREKSDYCSPKKIKNAFEDLINNAKAKYIFVSYNNEGLMSPEEIRDIMSKCGDYSYFTKEYNRFQADKTTNRNYSRSKTIEYLHYVTCEK